MLRDARVGHCFATTPTGLPRPCVIIFITSNENIDFIDYLSSKDLTSLRFTDVGELEPATFRLTSGTLRTLGYKPCCLRQYCIPNVQRMKSCNALDLFYGGRRSRNQAQTAMQLFQARELGRKQKQEAEAARADAAARVAQRRLESGMTSEKCRAWQLGRCAKGAGCLATHGSPAESLEILCCSAREPGMEGFSRSHTRCSMLPPTPEGGEKECIYKGHVDKRNRPPYQGHVAAPADSTQQTQPPSSSQQHPTQPS